jgi:hypothetical protein
MTKSESPELNIAMTSIKKINNQLPLIFSLRLFILLTMGFIVFTVIGTVSHECGHYLMAKYLGYKARINYASTFWYDKNNATFLKSHWMLYHKEIKLKQKFPGHERFERLQQKYAHDGFWFTLAGPVQTMLTGTIGLILLIILKRRYFSSTQLSFTKWLLIFISLFWLRQAANFFVGAAWFIVHGSINSHCDEFLLAGYLNVPKWTFSIITASIALIVLGVVIFKFIPNKERLTFILAGLVGGVGGYLLWLTFFGKVIMP